MRHSKPTDGELRPSTNVVETLGALVERIYPDSAEGPGATELGVVDQVLRGLDGVAARGADSYQSQPFAPQSDPSFGWQREQCQRDFFLHALELLDKSAVAQHQRRYVQLPSTAQDAMLAECEGGTLAGLSDRESRDFVDILIDQVFTALFITPAEGGYDGQQAWARLTR